MQEYFAKKKNGNEFILTDQDNFHIERVLRMRQGDHIIVVYEEIKYDCIVSFSGGIKITINSKMDFNNELDVKVTLIYGIPKRDKFEFVIQKMCELGVHKVVPFLAKRSISVVDERNVSKKVERWNMIAKEACEQSKRNKLVEVSSPVNLKEVLNYKSELNLIAYEDLSNNGNKVLYELLVKKYKSITIVVGPEGGFEKTEVDFLTNNDFTSVSLGKRILRSETAPLYLMSVIGFINEREC